MENEQHPITQEILMAKYEDYILSHGGRPLNVYLFAKECGIEEGDFYQFFSGFDTLEGAFLIHFFTQSLTLTTEIENFEQLEAKEKILNLNYLLFEHLSANRSLILNLIKSNPAQRMRVFKPFKKAYKDWISSLDIKINDIFEKMPDKMISFRNKSIEETLWLHFISILRFWKHDTSAGFENTDLYIEKSIDTGFTLVNNSIIDKVLDLGKFMWKERF